MTKSTTLHILTFFGLAFGLTFAFSKLPPIILYAIDFREMLCGMGPLLGGLVCYQIYGISTSYSVAGTQPIKIWAMVGLVSFTFLLTNTGTSLSTSLPFMLSQMLYCFGEEYGWRHYLQTVTNPLHKWLQPFVIGLIWFVWHFAWLPEPLKALLGQNFNAPLPIGIITGIVSLALFSMFLGWTIQKTGAVLVPTLIHFATKSNSGTLLATIIVVVLGIITWDTFSLGKAMRK